MHLPTSRLDLPISPLYLACIAAISPLYLALRNRAVAAARTSHFLVCDVDRIPPISHPYLPYISPISPLCLTHISPISQVRTSHFLVCDVDLWPAAALRTELDALDLSWWRRSRHLAPAHISPISPLDLPWISPRSPRISQVALAAPRARRARLHSGPARRAAGG